jgi:putative CocE/NonD family hydrolase
MDQSHSEQRLDVLCFSTPAFDQEVEIAGPLRLRLSVSTTVVDTDFVAKLTDVYPDGRSYNLGQGIMRLSGRHLNGTKELIEPGQLYEIEVTMGHTAQLFKKGHRIRLNVTSSDFPLYDRNMNTGNAIGVDAKGIVATQTVFHDASRPSYIDLPIQPR